MMQHRLILASESPRRQALIGLLGLAYETIVSGADEAVPSGITPHDYVGLVAMRKASAAMAHLSPSPVSRSLLIAADTTVALGNEILGKPASPEEARDMLQALRGRTHGVHTGVNVIDLDNGNTRADVHTASVTMRAYSDDEIERYIASNDPMDKAGAYAIQAPVFRPVSRLQGCYLAVMGLSLCHLIDLLASLEVPIIADMETIKASHDGFDCPLYPLALAHYF